MTRTTRRDMLGALGFTGLAGIATAALAAPEQVRGQPAPLPHPDAELIALCDRVAVIERQWAASVELSGELRIGEPEYQRLSKIEAQLERSKDPLIERINALPTHTMEGYRARARLIVLGDYGATEGDDGHHGMLWALVSALAGGQADG